MDYFNDLFGGKIGTVKDYDDWDEELEAIVIDDIEYETDGETDINIDEFLDKHGTENLVLFTFDGYRGVACYSGYIKVNDKEYSLDIINEYVVNEIKPVN